MKCIEIPLCPGCHAEYVKPYGKGKTTEGLKDLENLETWLYAARFIGQVLQLPDFAGGVFIQCINTLKSTTGRLEISNQRAGSIRKVGENLE